MIKHLKYLKYVLRHKWFVFLACLDYGLIWRGIKHDWHKFLPSEWFPYVNFFYGKTGKPIQRRDSTGYYKPTDTGDAQFDFAWFLHQKRADHHWQWWVLVRDEYCTCVRENGIISSSGTNKETSGWIPNSVSGADSSDPLSISQLITRESEEFSGGSYAKRIGMNTAPNSAINTAPSNEDMIGSDTEKTREQQENAQGQSAEEGETLFSNTMGEKNRNVPVVGNHIESSFALTTSTVVEQSTDMRSTQMAKEQSINGSLKTTSQRGSESFVTTATRHSDTMDTAHTEICETCGKHKSQMRVLKMSDVAMKEMIADWRGAGRAQGKSFTWEWYEANKEKMRLHPDTRVWVESELAKLKHDHAKRMILGI